MLNHLLNINKNPASYLSASDMRNFLNAQVFYSYAFHYFILGRLYLPVQQGGHESQVDLQAGCKCFFYSSGVF
jgi:hypothetical protein